MTPKEKLEQLKAMYNPTQQYTNFLVYGHMGTGKTHLLQTCPKPVFVQSFDPGGCTTIRAAIEAGDIIVDNRYEHEDPDNPKVYKLWERETRELLKTDFFRANGIKTWAIDGMTNFMDCMLLWCQAQTVAKKSTLGGKPEWDDYSLLYREMRDNLMVITTAPVYVICTGHIDTKENEVSGKSEASLMVPARRLRVNVPAMFDEVYVTSVSQTSKGQEFSLLTQPQGLYQARSRLGAGGRLAAKEPANIEAIFKKAGIGNE